VPTRPQSTVFPDSGSDGKKKIRFHVVFPEN